MDLSEFLDELREIAIYNTDPQDWMNYLEDDESSITETELTY